LGRLRCGPKGQGPKNSNGGPERRASVRRTSTWTTARESASARSAKDWGPGVATAEVFSLQNRSSRASASLWLNSTRNPKG